MLRRNFLAGLLGALTLPLASFGAPASGAVLPRVIGRCRCWPYLAPPLPLTPPLRVRVRQVGTAEWVDIPCPPWNEVEAGVAMRNVQAIRVDVL